MMPPPHMKNPYSNVLFEGELPSSTNFNKSDSIKHYLHCLKRQCENHIQSSYAQTHGEISVYLATASMLIRGLRSLKIRGQQRDFSDIIEVIEAAVSIFDIEYGFVLAQEWETL
jgi:hypothetical protein